MDPVKQNAIQGGWGVDEMTSAHSLASESAGVATAMLTTGRRPGRQAVFKPYGSTWPAWNWSGRAADCAGVLGAWSSTIWSP